MNIDYLFFIFSCRYSYCTTRNSFSLFRIEDFLVDEIYGERLLISKTKKIASGLYDRHEDFTSGNINECYVVHNSKAVVVKPDLFAVSDKDTVKKQIEDEIEKLRT